MAQSRPFYEQLQAHYDLSDEFFALFLDKSRTYSCAYFVDPQISLEEAQRAKIDLSLSKCDLRPGQVLLDIGCGWGATARRAAERYGVHVIGLTLSRNQYEFANHQLTANPVHSGSLEIRLQGWEEFDEPVDRIVSIGAFEHFRKQRHQDFFERCHRLLPSDGRMMLHTIVYNSYAQLKAFGLTVGESDIAFARFIREKIFPGGELCDPERIMSVAEQSGFDVFHTQSLREHYARTLDAWAENLAAQQLAAEELTSPETYQTYMAYLTGCAVKFRECKIDVIQFCMRPAD